MYFYQQSKFEKNSTICPNLILHAKNFSTFIFQSLDSHVFKKLKDKWTNFGMQC